MANRINIILSQGQSNNPARRRLEEEIVAGLMFQPGFDVTVIPHLYDLKASSTGMLALQGITGDMIIISWMFERAAHWILDRNQISGRVGTTLLVNEDDDEEEEIEEESAAEKNRVADRRDFPRRRIYCLDLKTTNDSNEYLEEAKRIQAELSVKVVSLNPLGAKQSSKRIASDRSETNGDHQAVLETTPPANEEGSTEGQVQRIEERAARRWYPVIDYSRCTNCLECIDFCLFGVYGVDRADTILVEQPDNCRKGCPACSRVCPENAIIFPQHKTPAIAGSSELGVSLKIDLSQLFGAPDKGLSANQVAADERDTQLAMTGRQTVGMMGLEKRQPNHKRNRVRDKLDDLVDQLDQFDL